MTNVLRDAAKSKLDGKTRCVSVPSLMDGSRFSIVCWTTFVVDVISRLAAVMAVMEVAKLSEALYKDGAAYWRLL